MSSVSYIKMHAHNKRKGFCSTLKAKQVNCIYPHSGFHKTCQSYPSLQEFFSARSEVRAVTGKMPQQKTSDIPIEAYHVNDACSHTITELLICWCSTAFGPNKTVRRFSSSYTQFTVCSVRIHSGQCLSVVSGRLRTTVHSCKCCAWYLVKK